MIFFIIIMIILFAQKYFNTNSPPCAYGVLILTSTLTCLKHSLVKMNPCTKFGPDRPSRLATCKEHNTHTHTHITNFSEGLLRLWNHHKTTNALLFGMD